MRFPQYATERLVTAAALLTALTLAGCSSASQMPTGGGTSGQSAGTAPSSGPVVPMPATTELRGSAGVPSAKVGAAADSFAAAPSPASAPIPPGFPAPLPRSSNAMEKPAAQPGAAAAGGNPAAPQQPAPAANFDRMIIYTTTIALTVKDVPAAVDEVSGLTARSGGYLSGSSVRQEGER
ncbi:MAG: hypothetical protein NTZ05_04695, partial [Chloroflexi bacterium]|nr:hypothetical protein [Chloroflexota bacterium]